MALEGGEDVGMEFLIKEEPDAPKFGILNYPVAVALM